MKINIPMSLLLLVLSAGLCGCVEKTSAALSVTPDGGAEVRREAVEEIQPNRKVDDPNIDINSQAVIAATILQMMHRNTAGAPVTWDKGGDFKAAFEGFCYEGFAVTGVDVFDQQQASDGEVTVQALVNLRHRKGMRASNALMAVYSFAKDGRPVIRKTLAGPIPSRTPEIEVMAVPADKVAKEKAFRQRDYPGWLAAARKLAQPLPEKGKSRVYIFVFAKDRVLAGASVRIESNGERKGQSLCIDDFGFAACMVGGEIAGTKNKALLYLNGSLGAEAIIR